MGVLEQMFAELQAKGVRLGQRDFPSGSPDSAMMHGPNGLFGVEGIERPLISTHVMGPSLATRLPARENNTLYPLFGYITGFQDITGEEQDGPCDDPPTVGHMKGCLQTAHFGLYSRQTRELDIRRVGEVINRGEFTDLFVVNNPLVEGMRNLGPMALPGMGGAFDMQNEMAMRMLELGPAFQRLLGRQVYEGDPANATNGGYDEFPGLNYLVTTGHIDAKTQTTCPSLDSQIYDFDYTAADDEGGTTLINRLVYTMRYLQMLAESTGLDPVNWVIVMRPALFYELTAIWPCSYMTYRCMFGSSDQARVNVDGRDMVEMRDAMRNGKYLMIDGKRIEVVTDAYMVEQTEVDAPSDIVNGQFASDIYILPLTVAGGFASLYWEYFNYQRALQAGQLAMNGSFFQASDGGRFLWIAKPPQGSCVQVSATTRPRLVLRTPHLAARIQNVLYEPLLHERDVHPDDSYWVDGGVVTRGPVAEPYSQWNPA